MAKNKKRKYHRPPASKNAVQKPLLISQCMIVKNEEKNIERALSWAKPIVFEQIVVDTGSTDKTVEIAESMGAKVYHFEWINDFSAAKNYAIDQAKGDWIAFLDADEYFTDEDTIKLVNVLTAIESDPRLSKMKTAVHCSVVNIDDEGKPFLVLIQQRIFRNTPEIRYAGSIHEGLTLPEPSFNAPDLSIMHTGYTKEAYADTGKATRNISMIEAELSKRPDDATLKCYLADSLRVAGSPEDISKAELLYREALSSGTKMLEALEQGAYNYLISRYYDDEEKAEETLEFCRKAYEKFPENPDFCYYYGRKLHFSNDYKEAWEKFTECETLLQGRSVGLAGFILKHPIMLFFSMTLTAESMGNMQEVIRCATLALKEDKHQPEMLAPYISAFNKEGYATPAEEIFMLLGKLYDFNNTKDKITVMRAAKTAENMELVAIILSAFTSEELKWLTQETG